MGKSTTDRREDISYTSIDVKLDKSNFQNSKDELTKNLPLLGVRHGQALIGFLLIFVFYGARSSLSSAIVAMTDPTVNSDPAIPTYPEWQDKSVVLSAFFWGYVLPQPLTGWLTNRYGPKWFLVVFLTISSALGSAIPLAAAQFGSKGVMVVRAFQGFFQGLIYPSVAYTLSHWVPVSERSRMATFIYSGAYMGTVVALLVTGALSTSKYGWPIAFHFFSFLGIVWCILMAVFGYDTPEEHPKISKAEKFYIEHSLGHANGKKKLNTPWKAIFTSVPISAILAAQCTSNFVFYLLITQIPLYMSNILKFDMDNNSFMSSLPYLTFVFLSFFFSTASDAVINRNIFSIGTCRKIFTAVGLVIPAAALIILGYTDPKHQTKAVCLLVIAVASSSAILSGWAVNPIDLAPNHAGTVNGLTSSIGNSLGFVAPLVSQVIVTDQGDISQWRIIFLISAAGNVLGAIYFAIFGSGEIQPWNDEIEKSNGNKTSKM
ncbi:putative inorganic phosphate cotransporter [Cylas formicarius]|uniref:putative inorganic phosphate cotransporter n=1 Tax=Cylas formicarius TaxID=197179 RepID=UPI0029583256|nr:putative inorganic phosphate cotransporter [Cylas formicarius]